MKSCVRGDPSWLKYCPASLELKYLRVDCSDFFVRSVFSKIEDTFAWNQQFKVGSFAFGAHKLGRDFSHAL